VGVSNPFWGGGLPYPAPPGRAEFNFENQLKLKLKNYTPQLKMKVKTRSKALIYKALRQSWRLIVAG
jgi:hypothetical protein